ncbi:2,3-bisphosphoglycerate-independent phosphoglycerate mutase [Desulfohalobium retbaense]|uniref:Phosphonopyruvate decarboxylase-related protein n=1 Tax=Desulfohalobium retbaense (strain ATCC 49708 / DSM 5692 / JCM 16813 / HR100) TaxID=485915 RepID=C8X4J1_DESRD|nr:2,3-bisphosphoglycerate-independent phosphoglycerate mutase [Desulfohalobium retbaense]ACV69214.1 phosphonopyruvate decarboxylase-related protein [Desulfohalobium retbaense DSM 5692]
MLPKIVFCIADGMGDYPVPSLGGKTPLEAAETPELDALCPNGLQGQAQTIPEGMGPGSDVANMALLGYPPRTYHTGRGPIEAAAQGLTLASNDIVWRLNLVTTDGWTPEAVLRDYAAGHIDTATARDMILELNETFGDSTWQLVPGIQYRHLLVQKGGADSPEAELAIRPPHDILDQPIGADLEAFGSSPALKTLLASSAERLASRGGTATALWPWGQGKSLHLPDFSERFGLKGQVVSAVDLVKGLGRAAQMDVAEVPGATGLLDTNYAGKVEAALEFLDQGDFVYLHVEAPDECGHAGDPEAKQEAIARFDSRVLAPLRQALGQTAYFMVACDHLTPVRERTHTSDPVPFLLSGPGLRPNTAHSTFTEATADSAELSLSAGEDLLPFVLKTIADLK